MEPPLPPESAVRAAVRSALQSGVGGTQVLMWVMEETANEVDFVKEGDDAAD